MYGGLRYDACNLKCLILRLNFARLEILRPEIRRSGKKLRIRIQLLMLNLNLGLNFVLKTTIACLIIGLNF